MYPRIKNKATQAFKSLRLQIILIVDFILNEMYPTIRSKVIIFFSDPTKRTVFLLVILLIVILAFGIGDDHSG